MPEILIKFNLPEDNDEYKIYSRAMDMHLALWDFSQGVLRKLNKYGYHHVQARELTEEEHAIVEHISEEFYKILEEYEVKL